MDQIRLSEITGMIDGDVAVDAETIDLASRDASLFEVTPQAVIFPKNAQDIGRLVNFAARHAAAGVSLTVRSGGTDMSGGPLNNSLILDMTRHFNHIKSVTDRAATVQPGVYYRDFEAATLKHNLLLPSYPASREICTVGGMVANNSGGEKTLRYGKTAHYLQSLKAVLADGKEHTLAPLTRRELEQEMAAQTPLGRIYRSLYSLLTQHHDRLQRAKPTVSKNSAGYALWDVWNPAAETFDLTQLISGSQGTLGIVTEITFRLITPSAHRQMLVIFLPGTSRLAEVVRCVLQYQPESFESYDDHTFKIALRYLPDLLKQMKTGSLFSLAWQFLPEAGLMLRGGVPKLVLLAEFTGNDPKEVRRRTEAAQQALHAFKLQTRLTRSAREAEKFWAMRRESFNLLRHHVHHQRTAPFIDDIIILPEQLSEFLPRLDDIMDDYRITYTVAGHVGDANFHIIPLMNVERPDFATIISELSERVYDLVLAFHGSITAEHNDGIIRTPYLEKMYGKDIIRLFARVKKIFDPDNIFNPGKKVGLDWRYLKNHLIDENEE
ncbi:MAG: FAD-binding oxidoreductase [Candidatus Andersenbacteria bacterium CG10_big_fil_rev_8_21_14_0_10_54_11]|uniref:D-lactate dehydrogenase (cytochrome) n=1 Tax=Candidatus Andersenbacteria bacterium CG10_big_fil_rev_8_21_14_0_10_54_11 TaxID=1974485 RepID=A0A2M6X0E9_9BACT|nr:MAG: FAD-binding oxidoreductase [Candidatus Andersenbacteria bacterium CG10_big_fil_rev_8_21_14_0_10_54_11]